MARISFFNEESSYKLSGKTILKNYLKDLISNEGKVAGDISIVFCSDHYLLKVNQDFLKHDYFTDIITFDYGKGQLVSGDLIISIDRATENAKTYQATLNNEVLRLITHGVLHLVGYKDKSPKDKELMTSKENFYLCRLDKEKA